jgi:O-6-methylguanine DNA methyltransferase
LENNFRLKVYDALKKIPAGKITTYKEIAGYLNTRAYRAVGRALALNPYAPEVPCHRIVKSNGELGGYSGPGGLRKKIRLLKNEGVDVKNNRVVEFEKVFFRLK